MALFVTLNASRILLLADVVFSLLLLLVASVFCECVCVFTFSFDINEFMLLLYLMARRCASMSLCFYVSSQWISLLSCCSFDVMVKLMNPKKIRALTSRTHARTIFACEHANQPAQIHTLRTPKPKRTECENQTRHRSCVLSGVRNVVVMRNDVKHCPKTGETHKRTT